MRRSSSPTGQNIPHYVRWRTYFAVRPILKSDACGFASRCRPQYPESQTLRALFPPPQMSRLNPATRVARPSPMHDDDLLVTSANASPKPTPLISSANCLIWSRTKRVLAICWKSASATNESSGKTPCWSRRSLSERRSSLRAKHDFAASPRARPAGMLDTASRFVGYLGVGVELHKKIERKF